MAARTAKTSTRTGLRDRELWCSRMVWNGVAGVIESLDDVVDRHQLVVELHGHRVLVHVGSDGLDLRNRLDGRTGLR